MFAVFRFSLAFIVVLFTGCVSDSTDGVSKGVSFDKTSTLEKFEGVYLNRATDSDHITLTSMVWPKIDKMYRPDLIEVRYKPPNLLVIRFYEEMKKGLQEANIVYQEVLEEGKDFALKKGIISGALGDRESWFLTKDSEPMDAFTPLFSSEKETFFLGIDTDGHGKLRRVNTMMVVDIFTAFLPIGGKDFKDFRFERIQSANKLELVKLGADKIDLLRFDAEHGDAETQLALFNKLRQKKPNEALIWLCRSADSGSHEARVILAEIYEHGGYTWINKGVVERNDKIAYVWYALSGTLDQDVLQFFADLYLTSEQQLEAEKMVKEWQPGQCEQELGQAQNTQ